MLLLYAVGEFFYPSFTVKIVPSVENIKSWDKEIICDRSKPTPLHLNFLGNSREHWIAIMFGRENDDAQMIMIPRRGNSGNARVYGRFGSDFKDISTLNDEELKTYMKYFDFTKEEEAFMKNCVDKAFALKLEI